MVGPLHQRYMSRVTPDTSKRVTEDVSDAAARQLLTPGEAGSTASFGPYQKKIDKGGHSEGISASTTHLMRMTTFDIKLLVVPERLSMSQRRMFQAGLEAVNRGSASIDPGLANATLTVDGRRSEAWDRAI